MPKYRIFAMILSSLMLMSCAGNQPAPENAVQTQAEPAPAKLAPAPAPDNRPGNDVMELWGEKVPDPYRWLEDATNEDVKTWIAAQDKRTRDYLAQMPTREQFKKRLTELMYRDKRVGGIPGIPTIKGKRIFYYEAFPEEERITLNVRDLSRPDEALRVLIDSRKLSEDGSISLNETYISPDGSLMAYQLTKNNADEGPVYIMNVETGETLNDKIDGMINLPASWLHDNSGFYYTRYPTDPDISSDIRTGKADIRFHKVGTDASEDSIIIEPHNDPTKSHWISVSDDGLWLEYGTQFGWNGNTIKLRRIDSNGEWFELPSKKGATYKSKILSNAIYIYTNDSASHYRILKIDLSAEKPDLSENAWQTIIPEFEDRVIEDFAIVQDKLFVQTLKDIVNYLDVYDLNGKWIQSIEMPDKGTILGMSGTPTSNALYIGYQSFKIDKQIYRIDPGTLQLSNWYKAKSNVNPEDIIVEQLFATSKDGTKVPMFVLRHKDTKLDGTTKTIISGYGCCGMSTTPFYSPITLSWIEQGGIWVESVLRGGGEYGNSWHEDGSGLKKQNSFDDFYAIAEYLIAHQYTRPSSVAADGGSAGGLLVGAALTQRPDLYGAVVCSVPLLDMLRFQMFGNLARTATNEFGNAEASEAEFKNLRSYSPYHNVKKTAYPSVIFLGADSDERIGPMHARKMTAAVQDATTSDHPVLLRIEKNSGHAGTGMQSSMIEKYADIFSFLWEVLE